MNLWLGAHGLPTRAEVSPSSSSVYRAQKRREGESSALKLTTLHLPKSRILFFVLSPSFYRTRGVEKPLHKAIKTAAFDQDPPLTESLYSSFTCVTLSSYQSRLTSNHQHSTSTILFTLVCTLRLFRMHLCTPVFTRIWLHFFLWPESLTTTCGGDVAT